MTVKILSAAGFDGSGGAGITSDVKIFSKYKILGLSAVTAMTAQNPDKVYAVEPVSEAFFELQLKAVFDYFSVDAVKIGLVYNESQSSILSGFLKKYGTKIVVADPVYISTSSADLTGGKYPDFLMPLLKRATVVTPNIMEAELISGMEIKDINEMKAAARAIMEKNPGIGNIVIKGSHLIEKSRKDKILNMALNSRGDFFVYESKRIKLDKEVHGTGCMFSSCLVSRLALGETLEEALVSSEKFVAEAIKRFKKIPDNRRDKNIYIAANI